MDRRQFITSVAALPLASGVIPATTGSGGMECVSSPPFEKVVSITLNGPIKPKSPLFKSATFPDSTQILIGFYNKDDNFSIGLRPGTVGQRRVPLKLPEFEKTVFHVELEEYLNITQADDSEASCYRIDTEKRIMYNRYTNNDRFVFNSIHSSKHYIAIGRVPDVPDGVLSESWKWVKKNNTWMHPLMNPITVCLETDNGNVFTWTRP